MSVAVCLCVSCEPIEPLDPEVPSSQPPDAWVLNEGGWGMNNASLSWIGFDDVVAQNRYFLAQNGRGLGDVAQDAMVYGGRLYMSVYESNTVEVVDKLTGKSIRQISLPGCGPRYLVAHEGKVYVSCYDKSVLRIDTATMEVDATCRLSGLQPEQLCVAGDSLYVCSAWESTSSSGYIYDSVLSVVDLSTFSEVGKVVVGVNPTKVQLLNEGRLVVSYSGNYANAPAGMAVVDVATHAVQHLNLAPGGFSVYQGDIYLYTTDYDAYWQRTINFWKVSGNTLSPSPILQQHISLFNDSYYPYGINVNPTNGDIYLLGAAYNSNGDLHCFSNAGTHKWQLEVGVFPSKVVVI